MKYKVTVEVSFHGEIEIEAEDEDTAYEQVEEMDTTDLFNDMTKTKDNIHVVNVVEVKSE